MNGCATRERERTCEVSGGRGGVKSSRHSFIFGQPFAGASSSVSVRILHLLIQAQTRGRDA